MVSRRKLAFAGIAVVALVSLPSFLEHVSWFVSGQVDAAIIQGRWDIVALNAVVFLLVVLPLVFGMRWRVDWRSGSLGVYAAFIVSLFVEMYGVPLTVYLTSPVLSAGAVGQAHPHPVILEFTVLNQSFVMTFWKLVGAGITTLGIIIVAVGWVTIYRSDEEVVSSGIYAYSRHPQYVGILLVVFGWFVHWPSLLTLALLPVLAYFYYRLALVEEEEVRDELGEAYDEYAETTPRFV
ncbi:MAG: isoprenylcysteine carboxylmethyltransferase family protein [Halobacteriales archaeon]|nr:isoprenylcysteine carboxylmethyltransferase family protein [Halobacteriales archaeon]